MKKLLFIIFLLGVDFGQIRAQTIQQQYNTGTAIVSDSVTNAAALIHKWTMGGRYIDLWDFTKNVYDTLLISSVGVNGQRLADSMLLVVHYTDSINKYITPHQAQSFENVANKAIDFSVLNNTLYPTTSAVNTLLNLVAATKMNSADSNIYKGYASYYYLFNNYYTRTASDSRYVQNEVDPLSFHFIDSNTLKNPVTYSFYYNHLPISGRGLGTSGTSFYADSSVVVYANDSNINKGYCSWFYANTHFGTGSGTVTNIATTAPITGGAITTTGTIGFDYSFAGTFTNATWRGLAISDGFIASSSHWNQAYNKYLVSGLYSSGTITFTSNDATTWTVTGLPTSLPPNGLAGGDLTGSYPNPTLVATGTAGTYAYPSQVITDSKGRVTSITAGSAPSSGTVTSVTVGSVSPLFTTTTSNSTTTPSTTFSLIPQLQNLFFASPNGSTGNPAFRAMVVADLPAGTGTVTNVSSADGNLTVSSPTTTPTLTVVSAPKLQTARTINGTSFDGTANITVTVNPSGPAGGDLQGTYPNPTLVTVNATPATYGSGTLIPVITVDANGRATTITTATNAPSAASITGTLSVSHGGTGVVAATTINATSIVYGAANTVPAAAGTLTGGTIAAGVTLSSLTKLGVVNNATWQATKIGLLYGGTNADLSASGGTGQYLRQVSAGAAITVGTIAAADYTITTATPMTNGFLKGVGGLGTFVTAIADGDIASAANWNVAYTNRITSLTTTGNSGAATLISNVLNIPNYTAAGIGAVPTARLVSTTAPLSGGGDLSADRTIVLGTVGFANGGTGATTTWTVGSVLYSTGTVMAQDNNNFYYDPTNHRLSVGTNGDFGGTDAINAYGEIDLYQPNSSQGSLTVTNASMPGTSTSSSRGTGASPIVNNTADIIGDNAFWGYTGSTPAYKKLGGMVVKAVGASSDLGGEVHWYTKADNASTYQDASIYINNLGQPVVFGVAVTGVTGTGSAVLSASPALTGNPTVPNQTIGDNSTKAANTAYVDQYAPQYTTATTTATLTPTSSTANRRTPVYYNYTAQATAMVVANPTGSWQDMQVLAIKVLDNSTARALSFGANFDFGTATAPTTTTISKRIYMEFMYDGASAKFDYVTGGNNGF